MKLQGRDHSKVLGVDGSITLECNFREIGLEFLKPLLHGVS